MKRATLEGHKGGARGQSGGRGRGQGERDGRGHGRGGHGEGGHGGGQGGQHGFCGGRAHGGGQPHRLLLPDNVPSSFLTLTTSLTPFVLFLNDESYLLFLDGYRWSRYKLSPEFTLKFKLRFFSEFKLFSIRFVSTGNSTLKHLESKLFFSSSNSVSSRSQRIGEPSKSSGDSLSMNGVPSDKIFESLLIKVCNVRFFFSSE